MMIVQKSAAILAGHKRYYTGIPCKHGHLRERMVSNGNCITCLYLSRKRWGTSTPEIRRRLSRKAVLRVALLSPEQRRSRTRKITIHRRSTAEKRAIDNQRHKRQHKATPEKRLAHNRKERLRPSQRLQRALRNRINLAVRNGAKAGSAVRDLGCSIPEFRIYIEARFEPGMSWSNYGLHGWHLDHIKPLASFDLADREKFLVACHYTNYQPLWALDNIRKGASLAEVGMDFRELAP